MCAKFTQIQLLVVKIFQTMYNGHASIPGSPNCITWRYKGLCIAQRSSWSIEMKKICILPLFHNIYRIRNVPSSPILIPPHIRIDPYFRWVHLFICLRLYIPLFHYKSDICLPWISLCLRHCTKQHSSSFCRGRLCLIGLYWTPSLAFKHIGNLMVFYVLFFYCSFVTLFAADILYYRFSPDLLLMFKNM